MGVKKMRVTRRGIQIALGALWLLDGLLQLQPRMFTAAFATDVIAPAAQGQPGLISGPMHLLMALFLWHPALANTGIALTQIGLGVLILWRRTAWFGLWGSVGWGLFVWLVGEGLSGLANLHGMMLMGLPGAALVYALLAVGALPARPGSHHEVDRRPAYWLVFAWMAIWVAGAIYQLLPGQNTIADNVSMISANAQAAPHWLATADNGVGNWLAKLGTATMTTDSMAAMKDVAGPVVLGASTDTHAVSGFWFLSLVALLQLFVAFGVIVPGIVRIAAVTAGCLLSLFFWVVGQSLGAYFSGVATDPNTGPLLILLGVAVLGCTQHDARVRAFIAETWGGVLDEFRPEQERESSKLAHGPGN